MAKYVPMFPDWADTTEDLTQEEKGDLIDAIIAYAFSDVSVDEIIESLTPVTRVAFRFMKGQIDRNASISESRAKAGASKKNKTEQTETNASKTEQAETNEANPVNNNNNKNKNDNKNDNKNEYTSTVVDAWNAVLSPKVTSVSAKRASAIKARVEENGLDKVLDTIRIVPQCPFLMGEKGWHITFDWFVNPTNFAKVAEGNYLPRGNVTPIQRGAITQHVAGDMEMNMLRRLAHDS